MALKKCKECGHEVSTSAAACPSCGAKVPKKTSMITWIVVLFIGASFALSFMGGDNKASNAVASKPADAKDQKNREFLWVEKGKESVLARLKDPDSATFKEVYFFRSKSDVPVACGQVNSKNALGGYAGYQHFISAGSPDRTWLEDDVKDFENLWNQFCR